MGVYCIGMGEAAATGVLARHKTLVSGGAADCIIIAVYNRSLARAYMVHAHRLSNLTQALEQIKTFVRANTPAANMEVHLASQVFGLDNAGDSKLVIAVRGALTGAGYANVVEHPCTSLSLTHTGVFTAPANAGQYDRAPSDQTTALAAVDFALLDKSLAPNVGGGVKSKESPI